VSAGPIAVGPAPVSAFPGAEHRALRRLAAVLDEAYFDAFHADFVAIATVGDAGVLDLLRARGLLANRRQLVVNRGWVLDVLAASEIVTSPFARVASSAEAAAQRCNVHAIAWSRAPALIVLVGLQPERSFDETLRRRLKGPRDVVADWVRENDHQRNLFATTLRAHLGLRLAASIDDGWDEATAVEFVLTGLHDQLGYRAADLAWPSADGQWLRIAEFGGEYRRVLRNVVTQPVEFGLRGEALRTGKPQRIADAAMDPRYRPLAATLPMRSQAVVPVPDGGRGGVLSVESDDAIAPGDLSTLTIIAERLGRLRRAARGREARECTVRRQFAHELHDSVVQSLSALRMLAESFPSLLANQPDEAAAMAGRIQFLARQGLAELRSIVKAFDPAEESGAAISVQSQAVLGFEQLRTGSFAGTVETLGRNLVPPTIEFTVDLVALPRRPLAQELMLVRVCHEAISNAVRHAAPRMVRVEGSSDARGSRIRIVDDGHGFTAARSSGSGLRSMRERVASLGGRFEIGRGPCGGTVVSIDLPPIVEHEPEMPRGRRPTPLPA
jgi:signal transduction histidine kinase